MARVSWNIQGKILYVGIEDNGREHKWKIAPTSPRKAEILREIADVLDPPVRAPRARRGRVVLEDEDYFDADDEEWDPAPSPRRGRPREAGRASRTQARTPYPPLDPTGEFSGPLRGGDDSATSSRGVGGLHDVQNRAGDFVDHSRGRLPDGTPILTPVPDDPDEADSHARLSRVAYEKGQAHANAVQGQDPIVDELPIVEARPRAVRKSQGLDSQGRPFLPPAAHQELGEGQRVRQRPKVNDPSYHFKDTH